MNVRLMTLVTHCIQCATVCTAVTTTVGNTQRAWSCNHMHKLSHKIHEHVNCTLEQMNVKHVLGTNTRQIFQVGAAHTTDTDLIAVWSHTPDRWACLTYPGHTHFGITGEGCIILVNIDVKLDEVFPHILFDHIVLVGIKWWVFYTLQLKTLLELIHTILINPGPTLHFEVFGYDLPLNIK